jgi:hypothetical protein
MCAGPLRQKAGFNTAIIRPILSFEPGVFIVSCRDAGFQHLFFRVQKPRGCHPVVGVQTFLFTRQFVVNVIPSAILATVESESRFHGCFFLSQR